MTQGIRPSQFILTYGPGTILESESGPVLMLDFREGLFDDGVPDKYEIENRHISGFLSAMSENDEEVRIFRIPTNSDRDKSEFDYIYKTREFPTWKLCQNGPAHRANAGVLYRDRLKCPVCGDDKGERAKATRFVMACRNGHLDDVPWARLIHSKAGCSSKHFLWHRNGAAMKNIHLECEECGAKKSLSSLFHAGMKCTGKYLESWNSGEQCSEHPKIILRQASNIRIPEVRTFLSIRPTYTNLHKLTERTIIRQTIKMAVRMSDGKDAGELANLIRTSLDDDDEVHKSAARQFKAASDKEIQEVVESIKENRPETYYDMLMREFHGLQKASKEGAPPVPSGSKPLFEVVKQDIDSFELLGRRFTVAPIRRLEAITVQIGYRRAISSRDDEDKEANLGKRVSVQYRGNSVSWYPGVSFMGEGVFITMDESVMQGSGGNSADTWQKNYESGNLYPTEFIFKDPKARYEPHPDFVWWHTLSHLLTRVISEDAGYSSASIRERIYLDVDGDRPIGGILLYSTQAGADGTLGGLTGLVPHFGRILDRALKMSMTCSADPICGEQRPKEREANGSCCYGCLMNSETSCDHRNLWLDRGMVRDSIQ